jgi:hypothetical protein
MHQQTLKRDQEADYRILVEGRIGLRWLDWFDGMTVITDKVDNPSQSAQTTLTGRVADQAALLGILSKLVTLNFPLLLVEHVPSDAPAESDS